VPDQFPYVGVANQAHGPEKSIRITSRAARARRASSRAVRPSVVLLGFVLGSTAAITFGLLGVALVFTWLLADYPRLESELPALWRSLAMFAALTGLGALSFYGQLRAKVWRQAAIGALVLGIAVVGWFHWPR
jgi:hypothetical protein